MAAQKNQPNIDTEWTCPNCTAEEQAKAILVSYEGPGDPWDLNGDGEINLNESTNWFRKGKGQAITLDASKVDLYFVDTTGWKAGKNYGVQTLLSSKQGLVLGNTKLHYLGNNKVTIYSDKYNFNQHGSYLSSPIRNPANSVGRWYAVAGTPYKIHFTGINTIFNPKTQPISRTFP